ncbi:MAG TPA: LemA family protein [Arthrobacter sp.]
MASTGYLTPAGAGSRAATVKEDDPWDAVTAKRQGWNLTPRRIRSGAIGLGAVAVLLAAGTVTSAVTLQASQSGADDALAGAVTQYRTRAELIPKLLIAVQNAAPLERAAMDPIVTDLQKAVVNTPAPGEVPSGRKFERYSASEAALGTELHHLVEVGMTHAKLKDSATFQDLARSLDATEPEISNAVTGYNTAAEAYNGSIAGFPVNLVAPLLGHGTPYGTLLVQ